jgi:hypothetical protein
MSSEQNPALTPEALVGALLAAAKLSVLPAQLWPLQAAFAELETGVSADGTVGRAMARIPKGRSGPEAPYPVLRRVVHNLMRRGLISPVGAGWGAGYEVSRAWMDDSLALLGTLSRGDLDAVQRTGQRLVAMATMLSKKPVVSRPASSATI